MKILKVLFLLILLGERNAEGLREARGRSVDFLEVAKLIREVDRLVLVQLNFISFYRKS